MMPPSLRFPPLSQGRAGVKDFENTNPDFVAQSFDPSQKDASEPTVVIPDFSLLKPMIQGLGLAIRPAHNQAFFP